MIVSKYSFYFILFFSLLLTVFMPPAATFDLWWHIQAGKDMVLHGTWPSPDEYSFTAKGAVWIVHSWLGDILLYLMYSCIGLAGLSVVRVAVHLFFASSLGYFLWKKSGNLYIVIFFVVVTIDIVSFREIRPYLFSEVASVFLISYLYDVSPCRISRWVVFLVQVAWINIHPEALVFYPLVFMKLIQSVIRKPRDNSSILFDLFLFLTFFLTPNTVGLLWRTWAGIQYPTSDWYSVFFWLHQSPRLICTTLILAGIMLFFIARQLVQLKKINLPVILFSVYVIFLSLVFVRFNWLLCLAFPLLYPSRIEEKEIAFNFTIHHATFICLMVVIMNCVRGVVMVPKTYPDDVVSYMMQNQIYANVWCEWTRSGYITYHSNKKIKVFCDTRIEPFPKNILDLGRLNTPYILGYIHKLRLFDIDYLILPIAMKKQVIKYPSLHLAYEGRNYVLVKI